MNLTFYSFTKTLKKQFRLLANSRGTITVIFAALGLFLNACEEDTGMFAIGEKYIESQTEIVVMDTFSVKASTVMLDEVKTSGTQNMLIGSYSDTLIGDLSSQSYFQLGAPGSFNVEDTDTYDSLRLSLRYNGYYFGDTTQAQKISVHRLSEKIETGDGETITGETSFSFDPTPLGASVFTPQPKSEDTLSIQLNDDLGRELFTMLQNESSFLSSNSSFIDYFHGLTLIPDDNRDAGITGFDVSSSHLKMILYTTRTGFDQQVVSYEFAVYDTSKQFNNITRDFSSTDLSPLTEQRNALPSSQTNHLSFLQGGIGLLIRIDFPSLADILLLERGTVARAQLSIAPLLNSGDELKLPRSLVLYETDELNEMQVQVSSAVLTLDDQYDEKTAYTFEITDYIQNELDDSYVDPEKGLLLSLPSYYMYDSFYRLIVDPENQNTELKLYYLSY